MLTSSTAKAMAQTIRSYLIISIGLLIYTFAWKAFLIPNEITGGGAAGVSTVIYYLTNKSIPIGLSIILINSILVVIGIRVLGRAFGAKTIFGIITMSLMFTFLPEPRFISSQFNDSDKLICAIIGGIVSGAGLAITFMQGGSAGGTDIIAMVINKYRDVTPGKVLLYADVVIIGSSYFINWDLRTIVYGYVMMGVFSYTIDLLLSGNKQSVQIFIFSKHYENIANTIIQETKRGVTALSSIGWYTKQEGRVLVVNTRKYELNDIYRIVKGIDPEAFISVASVMGVFGKGFDQIKTPSKKIPLTKRKKA